MTPLRSRRFAAAAFALAAVFAVGACGGGGGDSKEPPKTVSNGEITIEAFDTHFDVGDITAEAGPLKVTLINKGALEHTFKVDETDFELKAKAGETKTGTVTLEKGTYDYECTIAGHKQAGMKGKIQVS